MQKLLIDKMSCPYCLGAFKTVHISESAGDRIIMGLLRCRCFDFPIVEGVLLLSLTKGYGGSEEVFQPYVPLQAAAIEYLRRNQPDSLRKWMRRHTPFLADLAAKDGETYLQFMTRFGRRLQTRVEHDVYRASDSEVLGKRGYLAKNPPGGLLQKITRTAWGTRLGTELNVLRKWIRPHVFNSFYVSRFLGTDTLRTRSLLKSVNGKGQILSLCCGHGIFEFIHSSIYPDSQIVSVDGQILNLLATRKFINPDGNYICLDVQFPLPFSEGTFDGVFSSTCLPEIPAQASFVREALRVTAETGWTLFDTVWVEDEKHRVEPLRHYRYCQNFFSSLDDYEDFFKETCPKKKKFFSLSATEESRAKLSKASFLFVKSESNFSTNTDPVDFTQQELSTLTLNPRYQYKKLEDGTVAGSLLCADPGLNLPAEITLEPFKALETSSLHKLLRRGILTFAPHRFRQPLLRFEFPPEREYELKQSA